MISLFPVAQNQMVNLSAHVLRAGVIPFTIYDNRLYFLMGIDRATGELTDFGGHSKMTETIAETALRELTEETCEIFKDDLRMAQIISSPFVVFRGGVAILFIYIHPKWLMTASEKFKENQALFEDNKNYTELSGVRWLKDYEFIIAAFNPHVQIIWKHVQTVLFRGTDWNRLYWSIILKSDISIFANPLSTTNGWLGGKQSMVVGS